VNQFEVLTEGKWLFRKTRWR